MKRFLTFLFLMLFCGVCYGAGPVVVSQTFDSTNDETASISIYRAEFPLGNVDISIYGSSWSGTIELQRRFKVNGTWQEWRTVESFTENTEKQYYDSARNVQYKLKSTSWSSGSAVGILVR